MKCCSTKERPSNSASIFTTALLTRSKESIVQVNLLHPTATTGTVVEGEARRPGAVINSAHNLEWTVNVDAQSKQELVVKYQIDFPGTEKLDFEEKF